jgi:hypothetical protein
MTVKSLARHLKELDDRMAMGYFLGLKYEGAYKVRVPRIGIRETRDNIPAPAMHDKVCAASMTASKVPAGGIVPIHKVCEDSRRHRLTCLHQLQMMVEWMTQTS